MSDEPNFRRRRLSLWIIAMLVLYPLGVGPAVWIVKRLDPDFSGEPTRIAEAIYYPLYIGVDRLLEQPELWDWYIGLWVDSD